GGPPGARRRSRRSSAATSRRCGRSRSHVVRIELRDVVKRFGAATAVDRVSLGVGDGELFTLLGPSGCGKTTLLRMIAGFYPVDGGEIRFGERRVDGLPPYERNIGMVFQNYALWPHMTVRGNVTYGLRLRKLAAAEIGRRLAAGLAKVNLTGLEDRYPGQLSGGQQQRVALARALVLSPDILLPDEPLSNLDPKIRVQTALGPVRARSAAELAPGAACVLAVRPENVALDGAGENVVEGRVRLAAYLGNTLRYDVETTTGLVLKVDVGDPWHHEVLPAGRAVRVAFPASVTLVLRDD